MKQLLIAIKDYPRRIYARYRIARRLEGGFYIFKGSRGQSLVKGTLETTLFRVKAKPAPARTSGIAKRVEVFLEDGSTAMTYPIKPFSVNKRQYFRGKEITIL